MGHEEMAEAKKRRQERERALHEANAQAASRQPLTQTEEHDDGGQEPECGHQPDGCQAPAHGEAGPAHGGGHEDEQAKQHCRWEGRGWRGVGGGSVWVSRSAGPHQKQLPACCGVPRPSTPQRTGHNDISPCLAQILHPILEAEMSAERVRRREHSCHIQAGRSPLRLPLLQGRTRPHEQGMRQEEGTWWR